MIGVSVWQLWEWNRNRKGPPYYNFTESNRNNRRYVRADVEKWIEAHRVAA